MMSNLESANVNPETQGRGEKLLGFDGFTGFWVVRSITQIGIR